MRGVLWILTMKVFNGLFWMWFFGVDDLMLLFWFHSLGIASGC